LPDDADDSETPSPHFIDRPLVPRALALDNLGGCSG
jgi:hypothetical protein